MAAQSMSMPPDQSLSGLITKSGANPFASNQSEQPRRQLSAGASAGLDAPIPLKTLKSNMSPRFEPPALTGAAAILDEHRESRRKADLAREQSQMTSVNPATSVVSNLLGTASKVSSKGPDPRSASSSTPMSARNFTVAGPVAEPMQIDQIESSPTSMVNFDGVAGKDFRPRQNDASSNINHLPMESRQRDHSNHALTYPPRPPIDPDVEDAARRLSLPMPAKSGSSNKKHRCSHCGTEFTRHHNLKSHLLTHSQEKPFPCTHQHCTAKFRRLHDLKRHSKLHTGERNHMCHQCGRKFARGDALARHSKGPGQCAGRRPSIGDEDYDSDGGHDEGMDGVVYQDGKSANGLDESAVRRRKSEPNNHREQALDQSHGPSSPGIFQQNSSTFPGLLESSDGVRPQGRGFQNRHLPTSHLSPRSLAQSTHAPNHLNIKPPAYSQGGMTESPRPLSPGQNEPRRQNDVPTPTYARARSPNQAQSYPQQSVSRTTTQSNPIALPPLVSNTQQLPGLPGLIPNSARSSAFIPTNGSNSTMKPNLPPPINASGSLHQPGPLSAVSNPGSASSHQPSSVGSLREILNGPHLGNSGPLQAEADHIHKLESELAHSREIISRLREEVDFLRAQQSPRHISTSTEQRR